MRSPLLVLLAIAASTVAYKDEMLSSNRIPELPEQTKWFGNTCDECKTVIKAIVGALDDPAKLEELKVLLKALCTMSSFEAQCMLFANSIEVFLKRLEPYLRDEEKVCRTMHLCSNPKLTTFNRIGQLYLKKIENEAERKDAANDFFCDECQMAVIELKKVVDNEQERAAIKKFFSEKVCKRYAPKYADECNLLLEEFLPKFWDALDAALANPKVLCVGVGFCPKESAASNKLAQFFKAVKAL
ncbi:hypothetical protein PRIPAC_82955 [Pristionchus pacificus]|uniref:Uncharacterized protein n=1 Tax=Pristionchus pacificus TaxID=54126 RepID=A0A454XMW0_PRIPA|nr:hypothetical protein PRIPAC_82955 [Pristionchus pacificus]|eukprot:PDM69973.1 hypothetical protein PRIPAC_49185 [Pristionchus pacificus]